MLLAAEGDDDLVGDSRDDVGTDTGDGHDVCRGAGIDTASRCVTITDVP